MLKPETMKSEMPWIVLARVEDGDSLFADDPITADMLRSMAENYDPDLRMAPVISGYDPEAGAAGPSHWTGEWSPPLGFIRGLQFDGLNLWGQVEELRNDDGDPLVTDYVVRGFWQRSIGWWRSLPELFDRKPKDRAYLRHVALLGAEPPGIPNLPPLTEYFMRSVGDPMKGRIVAAAPACVRHLLDTPRPAIPPAPGAEPQTEEVEMTEEQIRAMVAQELQRALGPALGESLRTAVEGALAPLNQRLETVQTASESARTALQAELDRLRAAGTTARFEGLVRSGRLTPAQRASEEEFLQGLDAERIAKRLDQLERTSPINPARLSQPAILEVGEGEDAVRIHARSYSLPNGQGAMNQEHLQIYAEARSRAGNDPAKFREAAFALMGEPVLGGN